MNRRADSKKGKITSTLVGGADVSIASVHLSMAPQVRDDGEMATATVEIAAERCVKRSPVSPYPEHNVCSARRLESHSRFSPVWLYVCVRNELGRVKRFSQILHRCFFCALVDTFELNCPIID